MDETLALDPSDTPELLKYAEGYFSDNTHEWTVRAFLRVFKPKLKEHLISERLCANANNIKEKFISQCSMPYYNRVLEQIRSGDDARLREKAKQALRDANKSSKIVHTTNITGNKQVIFNGGNAILNYTSGQEVRPRKRQKVETYDATYESHTKGTLKGSGNDVTRCTKRSMSASYFDREYACIHKLEMKIQALRAELNLKETELYTRRSSLDRDLMAVIRGITNGEDSATDRDPTPEGSRLTAELN